MSVKEIGTDNYEVSEFVQAMPHLTYTVTFEKGTAHVTARSGCTTKEWDQHAIQTVQAFLVTGRS